MLKYVSFFISTEKKRKKKQRDYTSLFTVNPYIFFTSRFKRPSPSFSMIDFRFLRCIRVLRILPAARIGFPFGSSTSSISFSEVYSPLFSFVSIISLVFPSLFTKSLPRNTSTCQAFRTREENTKNIVLRHVVYFIETNQERRERKRGETLNERQNKRDVKLQKRKRDVKRKEKGRCKMSKK